MRRIFTLFWPLLLLSLACNAPLLAPRPTIPPPPTADLNQRVSPTPQPIATATVGTAGNEGTSLPTFTPRPSNLPTRDPNLPTLTPLPPEATPSPSPESSGPLSFSYTVVWRLDNASGQAIATLTIYPTGGNGQYQYFRDELPVAGPQFEYRWAKCAGNPGSLRVTSADGQTLKQDYFSQSPCD